MGVTETFWGQSRTIKLCTPLVITALLLIVANMFSSPSPNRTGDRSVRTTDLPGGEVLDKVGDALDPVGDQFEKVGQMGGKILDRGIRIAERGIDGFTRKPSGELDE